MSNLDNGSICTHSVSAEAFSVDKIKQAISNFFPVEEQRKRVLEDIIKTPLSEVSTVVFSSQDMPPNEGCVIGGVKVRVSALVPKGQMYIMPKQNPLDPENLVTVLMNKKEGATPEETAPKVDDD
jgi:alpha-D-ribose 1-methylphosphonate 5-phosphate C-P lyase